MLHLLGVLSFRVIGLFNIFVLKIFLEEQKIWKITLTDVDDC